MTLRSVFVAVAVLALAGPVLGRSDEQLGRPTIYRLEAGSTHTQGCFGMCMCPVMLLGDVYGTMSLQLVRSDDYMASYAVDDVNWITIQGEQTVRVVGSGKYSVGGKFVPIHRLELDLRIGSGDLQHFDSGWQVNDAGFPTIDITVSMYGMVCFDTVFSIHANPVPASDITPMQLLAGSLYQQGCFDPCACPIWEEQPMGGTFALVPILDNGTFHYYALANVDWHVSQSVVTLRGAGIYTILDGFAGPIDRLQLDLNVSGSDLRFDSPLQNATSYLPQIDIVVSMNNMVCYDVVLTIHGDAAKPAPGAHGPSPSSSAKSPATR